MNPAQQQIVAEWNRLLEQSGGAMQQLLQEAAAGCEGLVAEHPTDPAPLARAIGAIDRQQVADIRRRVADAVQSHFDRIHAAGPNEPASSHIKRGERHFHLWLDEAWKRFVLRWEVESYGAMWPHVERAMQGPAACSRCGGPLRRATPHRSETLPCPACQAINQVLPEPIVARYYGGMPRCFAERQTLEKRAAIDRFKAEWEDYRDSEHAARRERPDEPLDRLKQLEAMELDCWTVHAETVVKCEGGTAEDAKTLIEARMKASFYRQMMGNDVWRVGHGLPARADIRRVPRHLENVDEWGPLDPRAPNAPEDDLVHDQLLNEAETDPPRYESTLQALGYRDSVQRAMVHQTFRRHFLDRMPHAEMTELCMRVVTRSMNERHRLATAEAGAAGLFEPVLGVSLDAYADLQAHQASLTQAAFTEHLARHEMDHPAWERVAGGWGAKMARDTTGVLGAAYAKAFLAAGKGRYGAAGEAAAEAMGDGFATRAPSAPSAAVETMSFEKYCEVQGANQAWLKQAKDVAALLDQHFKITPLDMSNVAMYWMQTMMQDMAMWTRFSELTAHYEKQYLAMP